VALLLGLLGADPGKTHRAVLRLAAHRHETHRQGRPASPEQARLIASLAIKAGFVGGIVVDFPNSAKARKHYLCLSFERSYAIPTAIEDASLIYGGEWDEESRELGVLGSRSRTYVKRRRKGEQARPNVKSADWIKRKKDQQRKRGKEVRRDSKYTGRKRRSRRF
jgi:18S rRNA (guanine1575-N7)-methyltransferase